MKLLRRTCIAVLGLALLGTALWFFGRAPTEAALKRECVRFQAERRERLAVLQRRLDAVQGAERDRLQAAYEAFLREYRTLDIRGWDIVLLPAGSARPKADGYFDAGEANVRLPADPPALQGPMRVWYRPAGGLARLVDRVGAAGTPRLGGAD